RASASPPASGRLETTCVTAPRKSPRRAAWTSAPRLDPRPEISTVMRESATSPIASDDHGRGLAGRPRRDGADAIRALARRLELHAGALGLACGDDHRHPDAAVEHAMHLEIGDVAFALQPVEDRGPRPLCAVAARLHVFSQ